MCMGKASAMALQFGKKTAGAVGADGKHLYPFTGIGCMAEYACIHETALIKADADVELVKGALVSCGVITGVGAAMNKAKVQPGSSCCIFGCGGVGLNAIQGCRLCGASQIIAVDTVPSKLEAARRFGATHTVNAKESANVVEEIKKLSESGTDYGFEVIGLASTGQQAYDSVKTGGTAVLVGIASDKDAVSVKNTDMIINEKVLTGSFMGSSIPSVDVPKLLKMNKKGDLMLEELVSKYYKITDAQACFDDLAKGGNLRGVFVMADLESLASGSSKL